MQVVDVINRNDSRIIKLSSLFIDVREKFEELCRPLTYEDFIVSVNEETSPPKWHLAHTSWFFEHFILKKFSDSYKVFHPEFQFLFNSYYQRSGNFLQKSKRGFLSRPTTEEIYQYRSQVTDSTLSFLRELPSEHENEILKIIEVGINHEQQHMELLLMDIKRNFFENPLKPKYQNKVFLLGETVENQWITFNSGLVKIGASQNSESFAYDNEKDEHKVWLESFQLNSHLVTNGEYLAFIEDGGYEDPLLWLSDGWDHKEKECWSHPLYWEKRGGSWWQMTLSGMVALDFFAPVVHVSYYEAYAYAKWKGCRLPSETEWEAAASIEKVEGQFLESGSLEPEASEALYESFSQIHGSVWQWTSSSYNAYPRYKPLESGLSEYNEKFMCNQYVLRGGSTVTPKSHYRVTYRNFYYPHMRWMYGGIRLAKDVL